MKGIDGRVYSPFRVRLLLGKRAAEHGWEKGAITMIERDPTPEGPSIFYIDSETARMVASQLTDAAHRLDKTQNLNSAKPHSVFDCQVPAAGGGFGCENCMEEK